MRRCASEACIAFVAESTLVKGTSNAQSGVYAWHHRVRLLEESPVQVALLGCHVNAAVAAVCGSAAGGHVVVLVATPGQFSSATSRWNLRQALA